MLIGIESDPFQASSIINPKWIRYCICQCICHPSRQIWFSLFLWLAFLWKCDDSAVLHLCHFLGTVMHCFGLYFPVLYVISGDCYWRFYFKCCAWIYDQTVFQEGLPPVKCHHIVSSDLWSVLSWWDSKACFLLSSLRWDCFLLSDYLFKNLLKKQTSNWKSGSSRLQIQHLNPLTELISLTRNNKWRTQHPVFNGKIFHFS